MIAYRTPVAPRMAAIENRVGHYSDFNVPELIRSVGGIWMELDGTRYLFYDGHHMTPESALEFSRRLARTA